MIDLTSVTATAIVRARDGSSIADWDETSAVPPDLHLADPDRIAAAIDILEGAGLTVAGVGDVTLTFSGTADAVGTVFGNTVVTTDLDHPIWGGTAGGPELTVAAGHRLAAQLATVRLESRPSLERTYGLTQATAGEIRPLDLYVGEVGQTLGPAAQLPTRLRVTNPIFQLPAIDTATRRSLADWRPKLRAARADAHAVKRHRRATINIVEGSGGPTVRSLLQDYNILGDPPLSVRSASADPRDIYHLPKGWITYRGPMAEAVLEWLIPAESEARSKVNDVTARYLAFLADQSDAKTTQLRQALAQMVAASTTVANHLDYLKAKRFVLRLPTNTAAPGDEDLSGVDTARLRAVATALGTLGTGPVGNFNQIPAAHAEAVTILSTVRAVLRVLQPRLLADRASALQQSDYHAQMVAWAVNGVTLGSVPATLRGSGLSDSYFWDPRFDTSSAQRGEQDWPNNVLSASWGTDVATGATWSQHRAWFLQARTISLAESRTLHVIAVGNKNQDAPTRPSNNAFLAGAANVILVGGCEPAVEHGQVVWKATEATQGFAYRIGSTTHHVPDICATTKGDNGGSMIYPGRLGWAGASAAAGIGADITWLTGGGSSLSCPIVAAVAGLVWTAFPELSAPELKRLLVSAAAPLEGGAFHYPAGFTPQELSSVVVAGSNQAGPGAGANRHPAGRVHLWDAYAEADRIYRQRFSSFDPRLLGRKAEAGR